jgi:hypothetical protein
MALTVYDTLGVPFSSKIDSELGSSFHLRLGVDLKTPDDFYSVILRFYVTDPTDQLFHIDWLPKIFVTHGDSCTDALSVPSLSIIQKRTMTLDNDIKKFMMRRHVDYRPDGHSQFFIPSSSATTSFFVNYNARYMVAFPKQNNVIRIDGILPKHISPTGRLRFIGFMACDLQTTETDDSISFVSLPERYTIWVAYSKESAEHYGLNVSSRNVLLLWKTTTKFPLVVYREIRTDTQGLFSIPLDAEETTPQRCQELMRHYYPKIQSF